jgi:hypothetical protein
MNNLWLITAFSEIIKPVVVWLCPREHIVLEFWVYQGVIQLFA